MAWISLEEYERRQKLRKQGKDPFAPEHQPKPPAEPARSTLGEIGTGLARGAQVGLPETIGRALQYTGEKGDYLYEQGAGLLESAKKRGERPDLTLRPEQHGPVVNTFAQAAEMIPASVGLPLAGVGLVAGAAAAAPVAVPAAAVAATGSVLGAGVFGMAQGQTTLEKGLKAGLNEKDAKSAARKAAVIEGAGEALANFFQVKALGIGAKAAVKTLRPGEALAKIAEPDVLKPWLKATGVAAAADTVTEVGQSGGVAAVEQAAGIKQDQSPLRQGLETIPTSLAMNALLAPFGLAGHSINANQKQARARTLVDQQAPGDVRWKAALGIARELKAADPAAATNFLTNARNTIGLKQEFALDADSFSDPNEYLRGMVDRMEPEERLNTGAQSMLFRQEMDALVTGGELEVARQRAMVENLLAGVAQAGEQTQQATEARKAEVEAEWAPAAQETAEQQEVALAMQEKLAEPKPPMKALPAPAPQAQAPAGVIVPEAQAAGEEARRAELGLTPDVARAQQRSQVPTTPVITAPQQTPVTVGAPAEVTAPREPAGAVAAPVAAAPSPAVTGALSEPVAPDVPRGTSPEPVAEPEPAPATDGFPTVADIHKAAEAQGIPYDNEPVFMGWTRRLTGKRHLDELTGEQRKVVLTALQQPTARARFGGFEEGVTLPERTGGPDMSPEAVARRDAEAARVDEMYRRVKAKEPGLTREDFLKRRQAGKAMFGKVLASPTAPTEPVERVSTAEAPTESTEAAGRQPDPVVLKQAFLRFRDVHRVGDRKKSVQGYANALASGWLDKPKVTVYDSMAEAPAEIRDESARQEAAGAVGQVRGVFLRRQGEVVMFADQFDANPEVAQKQILETLYHEAVGHYGSQRVLGDRIIPVYKRAAEIHGAKLEQQAKDYGFFPEIKLVKEGQYRITSGETVLGEASTYEQAEKQASQLFQTDSRLLANRIKSFDETVAFLAQTNPKDSIVVQVVAAIRETLRPIIKAVTGKEISLSDSEIIRDFILPNRRQLQKGGITKDMQARVEKKYGVAPERVPVGEAFQRVGKQTSAEFYKLAADKQLEVAKALRKNKAPDRAAMHERAAAGFMELAAKYAPKASVTPPATTVQERVPGEQNLPAPTETAPAPQQTKPRVSRGRAQLDALFPAPAEPTPDINKPAFQRIKAEERPSPGFFSKLQVGIGQLMGPKEPAKELALKVDAWAKKGAVPAAELEFTGLKDWLSEKQGRVTKEEVNEFLTQNQVEVHERLLGEGRKEVSVVQDPTGGWAVINDRDGVVLGEYTTQEQAERTAEQVGATDVEYEGRTLPGGKNYRELVLTLPVKDMPVTREQAAAFWNSQPGVVPFDELTPEEQQKVVSGKVPEKAPEFRTSHWSGIPNPIAHIRFDERTTADDGRTVFINELQSDWAQTLGSAMRAVKEGKLPAEDVDAVAPDMPFKGDKWVTLTARRMLKWAVDNDFDSVSWPATAQQVATVERWGKIEQVGDAYKIRVPGNDQPVDVTPIVNRYLVDLPREMNKLGKKWGAKVEQMDVGAPDMAGRVAHVLPITPELKAQVLLGQPSMQRVKNISKKDFARKRFLSAYADVDPTLRTKDGELVRALRVTMTKDRVKDIGFFDPQGTKGGIGYWFTPVGAERSMTDYTRDIIEYQFGRLFSDSKGNPQDWWLTTRRDPKTGKRTTIPDADLQAIKARALELVEVEAAEARKEAERLQADMAEELKSSGTVTEDYLRLKGHYESLMAAIKMDREAVERGIKTPKMAGESDHLRKAIREYLNPEPEYYYVGAKRLFDWENKEHLQQMYDHLRQKVGEVRADELMFGNEDRAGIDTAGLLSGVSREMDYGAQLDEEMDAEYEWMMNDPSTPEKAAQEIKEFLEKNKRGRNAYIRNYSDNWAPLEQPDAVQALRDLQFDGAWQVEARQKNFYILVEKSAPTKSDEHPALTDPNAPLDLTLPNVMAQRVPIATAGTLAHAAQLPSGGHRQTWDVDEPSAWDNFVYMLQDKHKDTKDVLAAITRHGGKTTSETDPYLREIVYHGRAAKRTEDFWTDEFSGLLKDMHTQGVTRQEFEFYLWNRTAERTNEVVRQRNPGSIKLQDGGSGIKTKDAQRYLAGLTREKKAKYEALAKKVDSIIEQTRQTLVEYGLETPETIARWKETFPNYVPLHREDMDTSAAGIGQGFSITGRSTKTLLGSTRKAVDILAHIADQRDKAILRGEKNRVAQALVQLAEANPNEKFWKVDTPPTVRFMASDGTAKTIVDPDYKHADHVMMAKFVQEDGSIIERAVVFNRYDERAKRMAAALKNLDGPQLNEFLGKAAIVTRYFASMNTQYNPVFGVINLTRDFSSALLNLSSTPLRGQQRKVAKLVLPALKGIYTDLRAIREGKHPTSQWAEEFEEFQREGGQTGYRDLFKTVEERTAKQIDAELNKFVREGKPQGLPEKAARGMFNWLSDYNTAMENALRLAAYKTYKEKMNYAAADEKGKARIRMEAAAVAKNLTVNFNKKGSITRQMGSLYAFFNASVQGTARMYETLSAGRKPGEKFGPVGKKIVQGGLLLGAMQQFALMAAGFDEDEPPQFLRERNLIIPIGDKKFLSIPMPLGFHVIPNISRMGTEWVMSGFRDGPERMTRLLDVMLDSFNPVGHAGASLQTLTPTMFDPLAALAENRDWTGKPIARPDYNPLMPEPGFARAKDTATSVGYGISYALNLLSGGTEFQAGTLSPTPDQIDYLIGQVAGGVGREAQKLEQTVSSMVTGEDLPTYKIPLLGRVYGSTEGQAPQAAKFFENVKRINAAELEIKGRRQAGRPIEDYIRDHPEARLIAAAATTERRVQELRRQKRKLKEAGASVDRIKTIDSLITAQMMRLNDSVEKLRSR